MHYDRSRSCIHFVQCCHSRLAKLHAQHLFRVHRRIASFHKVTTLTAVQTLGSGAASGRHCGDCYPSTCTAVDDQCRSLLTLVEASVDCSGQRLSRFLTSRVLDQPSSSYLTSIVLYGDPVLLVEHARCWTGLHTQERRGLRWPQVSS
jgi:hypothetical protein